MLAVPASSRSPLNEDGFGNGVRVLGCRYKREELTVGIEQGAELGRQREIGQLGVRRARQQPVGGHGHEAQAKLRRATSDMLIMVSPTAACSRVCA